MIKALCLLLLAVLSVGHVQAQNPQVTMEITGVVSGEIVLELFAEEAPITTANFIEYVQSGFYDGLIFHRVVEGFMIQGGGFNADLEHIEGNDPIRNESSNALSNARGTIAMARTPYPHSATSQFFINHADNERLDYVDVLYDSQDLAYAMYGYTVFGKVVSGMDLVDAIASLQTHTRNGMQNVPAEDVIIASARLKADIPVCLEKLPGDLDGNCRVDILDFSKMAQHWLMCNSLTGCD